MRQLTGEGVNVNITLLLPSSGMKRSLAHTSTAFRPTGGRPAIIESELGDRTLHQVVGNLVANALKFTPGGGCVTITLERLGRFAQIIVADTGVGIDPTQLPKIFETFWQADPSTAPSREGLGLGLAIVRRLVELHGGTIEAHSAGSNSGTRMTVRLPLAPGAMIEDESAHGADKTR